MPGTGNCNNKSTNGTGNCNITKKTTKIWKLEYPKAPTTVAFHKYAQTGNVERDAGMPVSKTQRNSNCNTKKTQEADRDQRGNGAGSSYSSSSRRSRYRKSSEASKLVSRFKKGRPSPQGNRSGSDISHVAASNIDKGSSWWQNERNCNTKPLFPSLFHLSLSLSLTFIFHLSSFIFLPLSLFLFHLSSFIFHLSLSLSQCSHFHV